MLFIFEEILIDLLRREGGYVNDPDDRGGATKYGITIGTLKRHGIDLDEDGDTDSDDVKLIDFCTAKKLYEEQYWKPARVSEINPDLQPLFFDMVVHHGQKHATRILQKAANACGGELTVDGIIGPNTITASFRTQINRVIAYRIHFMSGIIHADKSQEKFLYGWFNRSIQFWNDEQAA